LIIIIASSLLPIKDILIIKGGRAQAGSGKNPMNLIKGIKGCDDQSGSLIRPGRNNRV
jgi:hypothetical protein